MDTARILVVDDEQDICEILKFNLECDGYDVTMANSAEEALALPMEQFNLILLDVMMGGMSGFAMARKLKQTPQWAMIPIIFLTARDSENDTLTGLGLGADDYIAKPFSIREVILRVNAVLYRTQTATPPRSSRLCYDSLVLDLESKTVMIAGSEVGFTKTEFEILSLLLEKKGYLFSRQEIINRVWPRDVIVVDRTVDVNMTRMRKKLGPYANHIITRQGFGYYFMD
uniref:Response regulator transcription factor n=1 Tax=Prevotella sp. GTC17259 TaxID=3236795 RepID=A0AB33J8C1_9BACT